MHIDLMSVLINWFPMLLLVGVWLYFMRRAGVGGATKFQATYLEQIALQTAALEKIAATLEKRGPN